VDAAIAGGDFGGDAAAGLGGAGGEYQVSTAGIGGQPMLHVEPIDDLEGRFPNIIESSGRNGYWFTATDDSGGSSSGLERVALAPPGVDNHYAVHFGGAGFTFWGALLGLTFRAPFAAYDASAYCAVRFRAKGHGDGWTFMISDRKSEPAAGVCSGSDCYDHLAQRFQPQGDWQQYEARFDALVPVHERGQAVRALEISAVYSIQFAFESTTGAAFDLQVDDVSFVPLAGCTPK
jgi:hypothetical protein